MNTTNRRNATHTSFLVHVTYDLSLAALIAQQRMGNRERERVIENLRDHENALETMGGRSLKIELLHPTNDMELKSVLHNIDRRGRPATFREVMTLCSSYPDLRQSVCVIRRPYLNRCSVALAYWFDGAWRMACFALGRTWLTSYSAGFAYVRT
jgi:hypothetical protein